MSNTNLKLNFEDFERLFLSLANKTRLKLLSLMADEPVSVGFLVDKLGESQPKVSRHLAYLRNSGVVNTRRDGKWIYYGIQELEDTGVNKVMKFIIQTFSGIGPTELVPAMESQQRIVPLENSKTVVEEDSYIEKQALEQVNEEEGFDHMRQTLDEEQFGENESSDNELEIFLL